MAMVCWHPLQPDEPISASLKRAELGQLRDCVKSGMKFYRRRQSGWDQLLYGGEPGPDDEPITLDDLAEQ